MGRTVVLEKRRLKWETETEDLEAQNYRQWLGKGGRNRLKREEGKTSGNRRLKEKDWAQHTCCGSLCISKQLSLRTLTDKESFGGTLPTLKVHSKLYGHKEETVQITKVLNDDVPVKQGVDQPPLLMDKSYVVAPNFSLSWNLRSENSKESRCYSPTLIHDQAGIFGPAV